MKGDERRCGCREEDLLLHLYGESGDPGLAAHVAGCEECRRWLAEAGQVRELASTCVDDAGDDVVRAVIHESWRSRERQGERLWGLSRFAERMTPALRVAVIATEVAALIVMIGFMYLPWFVTTGRFGESGQAPPYISAIEQDLGDLEMTIATEERELVGGDGDALAALKVIDEQDLAEIEVSLTQVESGFGIRLDDEAMERSGR